MASATNRPHDQVGPDPSEIDGMDELISRMEQADSIEDWSFILSDYISWGNTKIHNSVGIFNFNSAHDCPNRWTDNCQVGGNECYAVKTEKMYKQSLPYRRRQEYLRDCLDPETFAKAFMKIVSRKRNDVTALRLSEAGDFRHNADVYWADRVAQLLSERGIDVYTYSASNYLDWSSVEHLTVNQSNSLDDYGVRLYSAVPSAEDIPDDAIHCPHDFQKSNGVSPDEAIKCGECRACIDADAPDIYITLH